MRWITAASGPVADIVPATLEIIMRSLIRTAICFTLAICITPFAIGDDADTGVRSAAPDKPASIALQPWQLRRKAFANTVQGVREGKVAARKDFDATLTEFETRVLTRTPIENMEIVGVFYIPKEGVEKGLPIVVMNAVLGWYDVLRFASESGRAEIADNEAFFKKPFIIGGPDVAAKALKFLETNPDRTAQLLAQGISFAEKFRETSSYDRRWPTAYGLERMTCAMNRALCNEPPSLPKEQWDKAWQEAKQRVVSYYQLTKPVGSNENSQDRAR